MSDSIRLAKVIQEQVDWMERNKDNHFAKSRQFETARHLDHVLLDLSNQLLDCSNAFYTTVRTMLATIKERNPELVGMR